MRLSDIDLTDPDAFVDGVPHDWFRLLRRDAPVYRHAEADGPGFWVLSRYEDLKYVSRNPGLFSSARGTNIPDMPDAMPAPLMLNMDPPEHVKFRRIVQRGFTPRQVRRLAPHIRELAGAIIDGVVERGECEFVSEIAAVLPMQVICEMMGIPESDRLPIYELSNRLIGIDDPEFGGAIEDRQKAAAEMYFYAQKVARERLANPGDDLVSALLTADIDGEKLTEAQFNVFFLLLSVAGNETTRTVTTHGALLLMQHPAKALKRAACFFSELSEQLTHLS